MTIDGLIARLTVYADSDGKVIFPTFHRLCADAAAALRAQRDEIAEVKAVQAKSYYRAEMAEGKLKRAEAERDALLHAAEHGLSLMLSGADGETELRLYHRCSGCESALKLLQAHGKYLNAILPDAAIAKGKG